MTTPARPQLDGLTAARGLAAWMVVLYHIRASTPWLPDWAMAFVHKGYLAVDFFFILSGFVIWLSASGEFAARGLAASPAFLRRRLARIYPLYATMLGLTVAFVALLHATGRDAAGYPWAELPLHILMLQNWGFTETLSWNHPAWSISTEFAAYLLFPMLAWLLPLARAPRVVLALGVAGIIGAMAAALRHAGVEDLGADIPRFGLLRCLCEFTAGAMLCALWNQGAHCLTRWAVAAAGMAVALAWGWGWGVSTINELWAFPLITASTIYLLADYNRAGGGTPAPLRYLGEFSYATYLAHFMLFIGFKIAFVRDAVNIAPHLILLYLLLTLAASVVLYHGVEKPGRRWVGKRGDKTAALP